MNPWSLFWRQGHSTTFGDYFKNGYEGAVADWWRSVLARLPENVVVMEVGCGNCSLLPAMIEFGVRGKYIGVDLATVAPSSAAVIGLADSGVELALHSETAAEELPEPDASVDLLASVFGIEYSDFDRSLPEAYRVLKPGGQFCALLHHRGSVVTAMSHRAYQEFNSDDVKAVLNALLVISQERDHSTSMEELKANSVAETNRRFLNQMSDKYLRSSDLNTANATMFEFMTAALKFFRILGDESQVRREFIENLANEFDAYNERFRQMVAVAVDQEGIERLKSKLSALGFGKIDAEVLMTDDKILAWQLCTKK